MSLLKCLHRNNNLLVCVGEREREREREKGGGGGGGGEIRKSHNGMADCCQSL